MTRELLRALPQIEKALNWGEIEALVAAHSRTEVVRALRATIDTIRQELLSDSLVAEEAERLVSRDGVLERTRQLLAKRSQPNYRRVINGTGVLLHTGLGRATLPTAAVDAVAKNLRGYSVVEVDAVSGERNQREAALRELLCELTGAESATIVNNNAAATLLILAAYARGKEVVLSRGQMVEIGGSFRVPDILEESGARLVEVGTTNRTYARDYEAAITPETGLLLQVHTSNYAIRGFAYHTPLDELVALGATHGIPVVSDLGSGCFLDLTRFGFEPEPLVRDAVLDGPDLVCFSGDKLLGGPQAGIIVGSAEAVARVRRHPLFRTLRVDKVTLTMMEATLRLYRDPDGLWQSVPILRLLSLPASVIEKRVRDFEAKLGTASGALRWECVETTSQTGSGSLPDQGVPSWALALEHAKLGTKGLAGRLREGSPPIFTRVHGERVLIDFRTVLDGDDDDLLAALRSLDS
jgi:L-seryl-tRNA(Ser) seleniumtransferase